MALSASQIACFLRKTVIWSNGTYGLMNAVALYSIPR
jgi:hypothetical protein